MHTERKPEMSNTLTMWLSIMCERHVFTHVQCHKVSIINGKVNFSVIFKVSLCSLDMRTYITSASSPSNHVKTCDMKKKTLLCLLHQLCPVKSCWSENLQPFIRNMFEQLNSNVNHCMAHLRCRCCAQKESNPMLSQSCLVSATTFWTNHRWSTGSGAGSHRRHPAFNRRRNYCHQHNNGWREGIGGARWPASYQHGLDHTEMSPQIKWCCSSCTNKKHLKQFT